MISEENAVRATGYAFAILAILAILLIAPTPFTALVQQIASMSAEERNVVLAIAIFAGFIAMALLLPISTVAMTKIGAELGKNGSDSKARCQAPRKRTRSARAARLPYLRIMPRH